MPRPRTPLDELAGRLQGLPTTFTAGQAFEAGFSKHALYRLRDEGTLEILGYGLYGHSNAPLADLGLIAIAVRAPLATLCLSSALAHHDLIDDIPAAVDVVLPRGTRWPALEVPVHWHTFDLRTFHLGRGELPLDDDTSIGLYSPERSIIDAVRTRGTQGHEMGYEALRRWLRRPGSQPRQLMTLAAHWPNVLPALNQALEILL